MKEHLVVVNVFEVSSTGGGVPNEGNAGSGSIFGFGIIEGDCGLQALEGRIGVA